MALSVNCVPLADFHRAATQLKLLRKRFIITERNKITLLANLMRVNTDIRFTVLRYDGFLFADT